MSATTDMSIPLAAETIVHLGPLPVTNAFLQTTGLIVLLAAVSFFLTRRLRLVPGRLQAAAEWVVEGLLDYADQVTGDRAASLRFLPLFGSLFIFILLLNWFGLFPGVGTVGVWREAHHGGTELIPLLRAGTSDLNATGAMAVASVLASHLFGVIAVGFFHYANRFIALGNLWIAVKSLNPVNVVVAIVELLVGLLELIAEVAKVLSLSLRLFGNIFAGEVLISAIGALMPFVAPVPFLFLELVVGLVQATVFSTLVLVYLTTASQRHDPMPVPGGAH